MGALANAVVLLNDPTFRQWCLAAGAYQARSVVLEPIDTIDHAVRLDLAELVLFTPRVIEDRLVTLLGTDPAVCSKGSTTELVTETTVLAKVAEVWTTISKMYYNIRTVSPN